MVNFVKLLSSKNHLSKKDNGFGLVDAILSLTLLAGIITYGFYFSSLRLSTLYSANLIRSINKEIERDIERLKLDFWSTNYNLDNKKYIITENECKDFSQKIINLPNVNEFVQKWRPGPERGKVFTGKNILITRQLKISSPIDDEYLNNSIARIDYKVEWGNKNEHWISIDISPEAHSWCEQII